MIAVRLCDIPKEIRLSAVADACRHVKLERDRAAIMYAALHPSENVYFVGFDKAPLVEELVQRQAA